MTLICSGGEDKKLFVWDVQKKKVIQRYENFEDSISCTAFHPTEQYVFASTKAKTISMYDLRTEKIVQHYEAHHDAVNGFSIHPSGSHLISVSANS